MYTAHEYAGNDSHLTSGGINRVAQLYMQSVAISTSLLVCFYLIFVGGQGALVLSS